MNPIFARLQPVHARQRRLALLHATCAGLLGGAAVALILAVGRFGLGWPAWPALAALCLGPFVGLVIGYLRPPAWREAAAVVDVRSQLKDRVTTALDFASRSENTILQQLQVDDALARLTQVDARVVVPFRWPRALPYALAGGFLTILLVLLPIADPNASAGPAEPIPELVAEGDRIQEELKELAELAKEEQDPALTKLVEELQKKAEEMKLPGVDVREALAKVSQIQAALAAHQQLINLAEAEKQLQELGQAMDAAKPLQATGKALQDGKLDKAAQELDKLKDPQFDPREAKTAQRKMEQVARQMEDKKLPKLGKATGDLANSLKHKAEGSKQAKDLFDQSKQNLSNQVKQHERKRRIATLMAMEQERLKDCKSRCQSYSRNILNRKKEGSQGQSAQEQQKPTAGKQAGNPTPGDKTTLQANRVKQELTGKLGSGSSEKEDETTTESKGDVARSYEERYREFQRESETVLESEPIPMRHRQMIRKYFELIRPANK